MRHEGTSGLALFRGTLVSLRHHALRVTAEWFAARADRWPDWMSRRLSLDGRAGFTPHENSVG
jgi:hypothetical protein